MERLRPLCILAVLSGVGCASVRPDVSLTLPGDVNPDRESAIVRTYRDRVSTGTARDSVGRVRVIDSMITDTTFDPAQRGHLIGKVHLEGSALPLMMSVWWFTDYTETWRKAYCYPQVILTYASSLVWSLLPPAYPCWTNSAGGVTKKQLIDDLRVLADVMGGDLAVASFATSYTSDSSLISQVDADIYRSAPGDAPRVQAPPSTGDETPSPPDP